MITWQMCDTLQVRRKQLSQKTDDIFYNIFKNSIIFNSIYII